MQRIAAMAAEVDRTARRPDGIYPASAEAILEELSGASPTPEWRVSVSSDAAAVVCLAKSVRILASMLAAREGVTIPIAGILDDIADAPAPTLGGAYERPCLSCGRPFASSGAGNRLCAQCTTTGPEPVASNCADSVTSHVT